MPGTLFYCDGNSRVGRGHLSRCLNLARSLKALRPRERVVFRGDYDPFSQKWLSRHGFAVVRVSGAVDAEALRRSAARFDRLVLDSYRLEQRHVDRLAAGRFGVVAFDDLKTLDLSRADLVINIATGAERLRYGTRAALGPRYLPVKPEFRAIREKNMRRAPGRVREILVILTGASHTEGALGSLLGALDRVLAGRVIRYVSKRPARLSPTGRNEIARLDPDPAIERHLGRADLVVSGGGMLCYEAAYCCLPNAALAVNTGKRDDTPELEALGVTLRLGSARAGAAPFLRRRLTGLVESAAALAAQRQACRRAFETGSSLRLARLVLAAKRDPGSDKIAQGAR